MYTFTRPEYIILPMITVEGIPYYMGVIIPSGFLMTYSFSIAYVCGYMLNLIQDYVI